MSVVKINAQVPWKIVQAEEGRWVGICDPLGLTVESLTWTELMEDIGDTLDAMFRDLMEENQLEEFLRDRGWKTDGPWDHGEAVRFDIPFIPALQPHHDLTSTFSR